VATFVRGTAALVAVMLAIAGCGGDTASGGGGLSPLASEGHQIVVQHDCGQCHSTDGSHKLGPTWKGLAGSTVQLRGGGRVTADPTYLRRSIEDPAAQVVAGFNPIMPNFQLAPTDINAVVAYIETLK
jgi:cytochrome c oxidase subunit 2